MIRYLLFTVFIMSVSPTLCFAEQKESECKNLEKTPEEIQKEENIPLYYKKVGDCYAKNEDAKPALENYKKALSFPGNELPIEDRLEIAKYFGEQDLYDEAIVILQQILHEEPKNKQAQILIARYLSWSGKQEDAAYFADLVLREDPINNEALQIKADTLNYTHKSKEAIAIYESLLQQSETFFARYGLALAFFNEDDLAKAKENLDILETKFPYQERLKNELAKRIEEREKELVLLEAKRKEEEEKRLKETCEALENDIKANTKKNLSLKYKALGDCYAENKKVEKALEAYRKALDYPQSALSLTDRLEISEYYGKQDKYKDAIQELERILVHYPNVLKAHLLLARYLNWDEKPKEGEKEIDIVLAKEPQNEEALQIKGDILNATKRGKEALPIFEHLLSQKETFDARYGLVLAYIEMDELEKAEDNFSKLKIDFPYQEKRKESLKEVLAKAIKELPAKLIKKEIAKARDLARKRCFAAAYELIASIIEKDPDNYEARVELAKFLGWDSRYGEALCELNYVLLKDPSNRDAKIVKATQLAIHRYFEAAYGLINEILEKEPEDLEALSSYARFLNWDNRYCLAIEKLEQVLKKDPNYVDALLVKASLYGRLRNYEAAFCAVYTMLEKDPKNVDALFAFAILLSSKGLHLEALAKLDEILVIDPCFFDAKLMKAGEFFKIGEFQLGMCLLTELFQHDNRYIDARFTLTRFLVFQEKDREAVAELETILALDPENLDARLFIAQQLVRLKCFGMAYRIVLELIRADPNFLAARIAYARFLSLDGCYLDALKELDRVLFMDPCNLEAMLVKAAVLKLKRVTMGSEYLYYRIIVRDPDNFEAKIGLADSYMQRNYHSAAHAMLFNIPVREVGQRKEVGELADLVTPGPNLDFKFLAFRDSDQIRTDAYTFSVSKYLGNWKLSARYRHVDATQPGTGNFFLLRERMDGGYLDFVRYESPCVDVGGFVGLANTTEDNFVLAGAKLNFRTNYGLFYVGSEYDVFADTAAALFFKIRTWANYITYSNIVSGRFTYGGTYTYTKYTDKNHANRLDLTAQYKIWESCDSYLKAYLGYLLTYWHFADQPVSPFVAPSVFSGAHGYFDPKRYLSNRLIMPVYYDDKKIFFSLNPYIGYATYHVLGVHYNGFYYVGSGIFGIWITPRLTFEGIIEGGKYNLKRLNYRYSLFGCRVFWAF